MTEVLIIDRSKWLRGEGQSQSALVRTSDNKMCCLGFYLCSLGFKPEELEGDEAPSMVAEERHGRIPDWLLHDGSDTSDCATLMTVNDSFLAHEVPEHKDVDDSWDTDVVALGKRLVDEADREKRIASVFAEAGVEVQFIDGEGK